MKDKLRQFIASRKFAFIASVDEEGYPYIKAMLYPRKVAEDYRAFYFSTNTSSLRVRQFSGNPRASVYFCSLLQVRGVMLRGRMEVLHDQALKDELWRRGDTQYYPLGVTDPDYCVLRFVADDTPPRTFRL